MEHLSDLISESTDTGRTGPTAAFLPLLRLIVEEGHALLAERPRSSDADAVWATAERLMNTAHRDPTIEIARLGVVTGLHYSLFREFRDELSPDFRERFRRRIRLLVESVTNCRPDLAAPVPEDEELQPVPQVFDTVILQEIARHVSRHSSIRGLGFLVHRCTRVLLEAARHAAESMGGDEIDSGSWLSTALVPVATVTTPAPPVLPVAPRRLEPPASVSPAATPASPPAAPREIQPPRYSLSPATSPRPAPRLKKEIRADEPDAPFSMPPTQPVEAPHTVSAQPASETPAAQASVQTDTIQPPVFPGFPLPAGLGTPATDVPLEVQTGAVAIDLPPRVRSRIRHKQQPTGREVDDYVPPPDENRVWRAFWFTIIFVVAVALVLAGVYYVREILPEKHPPPPLPPRTGAVPDSGATPAQSAIAFLSAASAEEKARWVRPPVEAALFSSFDPGRHEGVSELNRYRAGSLECIDFIVLYGDGAKRHLPLVKTAAGWRVDWDGWTRHGSATWAELHTGTVKEADMRVIIRPGEPQPGPFADEAVWTSYTVESPDSNLPLNCGVRLGTPVCTALAALIADESNVMTPDQKERFAFLRLTLPADVSHRKQWEITGVISGSWVVGDQQPVMAAKASAAENPVIEDEPGVP